MTRSEGIPVQPASLDWTNILFIAFSHLMAIAALLYMPLVQFSWWTFGLGLAWFALCAVSITGGYHRLFSHRTYQACWPLRLLYLLWGAASVQNSALKWSSDHRKHHAFTDNERDPYNINRGFWWAHIGWVLVKEPNSELKAINDLKKDPLVVFQDRWYVPLAIGMSVLVPGALGLLWGDPLGAMLVAGFLRLVIQWHATFCVNSVAHCLGNQPFGTLTSARDSYVTALITLGEGYHNFHHRFQMDYRNGIRWFHFDPTKWFVWSLSKVGGTWNLQRTPSARIAQAREEAFGERSLG
jgi:stearoyl-CoA desaturase (Delta-9 desaturase)